VIAVLAGQSYLAQHIGENLDQASESELPLRIQQLIELGDPGITALTEALNSDEARVAQAAEAALANQIRHWKSRDAAEASPRIAHLVRELAERLPQYRPRARASAGELAAQTLDWCPDGARVARAQFISDCALLVRAAAIDCNPTQPRNSAVFMTGPQHSAPPPEPEDSYSAFLERPVTAPESTESPPRSESAPLLNDYQPPKMARSPSGLPSSPSPPVSARIETVPQTSPESPQDDAREMLEQPPAPLDPPLTRPVPWDPRRAKSAESSTARHLSANQADSIVELHCQDDLSLMRRLHASSPYDARAARSELTRRGFDARHLRMAEDLTNPDPGVRLHFAQTLPAIRDVDIRPWLRTLADDDDPQVRQAAIAVIATLGTPESQSWLRRLQLTEEDPRIQWQLNRLLGMP
jgi:hypothetical protein